MGIADLDLELHHFYVDVARYDLQPLWTQTASLMPQRPMPAAVPWMWRWSKVRTLAERAGELVGVERGGERRVLALANPGLQGAPYASSTLWGAVQYLGPHESAPAHRHTAAAIRFVLEGEGAWTTVDGDACDMKPGDLVLTPNWCWHDHENGGDEPMLWFDGLDLPLARYLEAVFYENHPELRQPVVGRNLSEKRPPDADSTLLVYRWSATEEALAAQLTGECGVAKVRFTHAHSGADALPTMGCEMNRYVAGTRTLPYRKVGSSVFVVFQGAGFSVIDGVRFDWETGDMFVVPSWATVEHEASRQSDVFSISDDPPLRALRLFREEHLAAPQEVVSVFTGR